MAPVGIQGVGPIINLIVAEFDESGEEATVSVEEACEKVRAMTGQEKE